jgi:flagellar assembly protein FliH
MSSDWRVSQFEYPTVMTSADDRRDSTDVWSIDHDGRNKQQSLREAQAREIGRLEGEKKAKLQLEELLQQEREKIAEALRQFAGERSRYFEQVEAEVVQLALSIARKVLHREAQIDPDLLMGLVRYTLEKLRDGTHVKLRVPASCVSAWQRQLPPEVDIVGDNKLEPGVCVIETELGSTAISVDAQLKEIEQGLLDLLAQRPEIV